MNISIILLAYNHEKYICECLNSVKYQITNFNKERKHKIQLIISNDGSKDMTIKKINSWIQKNGHILDEVQIIDNYENIGTCASIINALKKCNGNYIKMLGGDDLFPPTSIFEIMSLLDKYDIIQGSPFILYDNQDIDIQRSYRLLSSEYRTKIEEEKIPFYTMIHRCCFLNAPSTFVKRELLMNLEVLDYVKSYRYTEDYPMWLKMSETAKIKYKYIPEIVCIYRRTQGSANIIKSSSVHEERIRAYQYAYKTCNETLGKQMLKNLLSALKNNQAAPRLFNIRSFITRWYCVKNIYKVSPFTISKIKRIEKYIKTIKKM